MGIVAFGNHGPQFLYSFDNKKIENLPNGHGVSNTLLSMLECV